MLSVLTDTTEISSLSTLEDVDLEIQRVLAYLQTLRTHHNTFVPISKLPADVLQMIFLLCAPIPHGKFSSRDLAFSQTCRLWRMYALENPFLWLTPVVERPRLAVEMLARAADCLVNVECDFAYASVASRVTTMDIIGSRSLEYLDVQGKYHQMEDVMKLVLHGSQKTLKYLSLESSTIPPRSSAVSRSGPVLLEDVTEPALFPNLQHLHLRSCLLSLSLQAFPNLTVLEIDLSHRLIEKSAVSLAALISSISRSSHLVKLSLTKVGNYFNSNLPAETSPTQQLHTFAHLKYLTLIDREASSLAALLDALHCPNVSEVEILTEELGGLSGGLEAIRQFLRCLIKRFFSSHQVQTFSYNIDDSSTLFKACCTSSRFPSFLLHLSLRRIRSYNVLHEIPLLFPLTELQSCTVDTKVHRIACELDHLWTHLGTQTHVEEIHADHEAYLGLQFTIERSTYAPNHQSLFPTLKTVFITNADLTDYRLRGPHRMTGLRRFALFLKRLQDTGNIAASLDFRLLRCRSLTPAREVFIKFGILKLPAIEDEHHHSDQDVPPVLTHIFPLPVSPIHDGVLLCLISSSNSNLTRIRISEGCRVASRPSETWVI
jgi:hypothetical protein